MAKEKKQREPIIVEPVFNSYQMAKDARDAAEKKVNRIKIGLIIAAVAELMFIFVFFVNTDIKFLNSLKDICMYTGLACAVASYVIGGGFLIALGTAWKISKTIGWIGWVFVPFPADIFTGLLLVIVAMCFFPLSLLFLPMIFVAINYKQNKVNLDVAEQYLRYCEPAAE